MQPKGFVYSRYSTTRQAKGDSARRQLEECQAFAAEKGIRIDLTLRDHGVSGYTGMNRIRGALGSFIRKVNEGAIPRGSYLFVDSMDRVSREDETTVLNLLTGLSLAGVRFVNVSERHILPVKPDMVDWIRLIVQAARAHQESAEKARKVAAAHARRKREQREGVRGAIKAGPSWLRWSNDLGKWERDPLKVSVLQRIFDLIEAGYGTKAIEGLFNREGVPPIRTGTNTKGWFSASIRDYARNRAVMGEMQPRDCTDGQRHRHRPNDGDAIPNMYPEVIDPGQFHRVQAILDQRRRGGNRKAGPRTFNNLLQGMSVCGECGGTFGVRVGADGRPPLMRCTAAMRGANGCTNRRHLRYPDIERAILTHVAEFEIERPVATGDDTILAGLVGERAELDVISERLMEQVRKGNATANRLEDANQERMRTVDAEIAALRRRIDQAGAAHPLENRKAAVAELLIRLEGKSAPDLYDLRAQLNANLLAIIAAVRFLGDDMIVRIKGGHRLYVLRRAGVSYVLDAEREFFNNPFPEIADTSLSQANIVMRRVA